MRTMSNLFSLAMDVVEQLESTKPRVEGEMVITHADGVEKQNGAGTHVMTVDEVRYPIVRIFISEIIKSPLSAPQNGQVIETLPPQASLPGADRDEGISSGSGVEELGVLTPPGCNMSKLEFDQNCATEEEGEQGNVQTEISGDTKHEQWRCWTERKFTCSEEASVDVRSSELETRDTTQDHLRAVRIAPPHVQKSSGSEVFALPALDIDTEPGALAARWSHEVSVDIILPDDWPVEDVEMAQPTGSSEQEIASPNSVELEADHSAFNGCQASESADVPTSSSRDEDVDFTNVEHGSESLPCTSASAALADVELITCERMDTSTQDDLKSHVKSTARVLSFADWRRAEEVEADDDRVTAAMVEEILQSTPPSNLKSEDAIPESTTEHVQMIWNLKTLKQRPVTVGARPRAVITAERPIRAAKPQAPPKLVGLSWPPTVLEDIEHYVGNNGSVTSPRQRTAERVGAADDHAIVAKPEEEIREQSPSQILWSLKHLKTRPVVVEPRVAADQPYLKPSVRVKAPKVVGLSWPPAPLTTAPTTNGVFT